MRSVTAFHDKAVRPLVLGGQQPVEDLPRSAAAFLGRDRAQNQRIRRKLGLQIDERRGRGPPP